MATNSTTTTNSSFSVFNFDNETSSPSWSPSSSLTTPLSATLSDGYNDNSTTASTNYNDEFGYYGSSNETTYGYGSGTYNNESTYAYGGYDDYTEGYGYDDYAKKDDYDEKKSYGDNFAYGAMSVAVLTLGLVIVVEYILHQIDHKAIGKPFGQAVLDAVYRECKCLLLKFCFVVVIFFFLSF